MGKPREWVRSPLCEGICSPPIQGEVGKPFSAFQTVGAIVFVDQEVLQACQQVSSEFALASTASLQAIPLIK